MSSPLWSWNISKRKCEKKFATHLLRFLQASTIAGRNRSSWYFEIMKFHRLFSRSPHIEASTIVINHLCTHVIFICRVNFWITAQDKSRCIMSSFYWIKDYCPRLWTYWLMVYPQYVREQPNGKLWGYINEPWRTTIKCILKLCNWLWEYINFATRNGYFLFPTEITVQKKNWCAYELCAQGQ